MDILFIVTSSLFFLWVIRELFYWLSVWQHNEYRQNRFFAYLHKRLRKPKFLSLFFFLSKWFIFFAYGLVIFNDDFYMPYQYLIVGLYFLLSFFLLREIYLNHLKKPVITFRVTLIIAMTLVTILIFFAIPLFDRFFWLLFIDLFTPLLIAFYVLLSWFPIEIYNDWRIEKAGQKLRANHHIMVIAVTGSVGKSLTKDYIATILSKKFRVIKTDGKNNTATGIATTILQKMDDNTQIFVAEISAYQQGEIGMLSEFIRPKIGVLTSIDNHYLPLFKSLENIKKTNFELIESLPKQGFCLYNGNSKNTLSLYKKSRKTKVLYRINYDKQNTSISSEEIVAFDVIHKQKRTSFTVALKNMKLAITLNSFHHIDALLPALFIASYLGMTEKEIKRAVALLK